jgi:hypothetical protein
METLIKRFERYMMELKMLDKFSIVNNFQIQLFLIITWEEKKLIKVNKEDNFEKNLLEDHCTIYKIRNLAININKLLKEKCKRKKKK